LIKTRVIPVLLLKGKGLYKTTKFKEANYIGDPINSVRIFNEKEVDELVFLDIDATVLKSNPDYDLLEDIAGEAFMPMAYGGGIRNIKQARIIFNIGFEKIILNSALYQNTTIINDIVSEFGSQSVVGCIDVKRNIFNNYELFSDNGLKRQKLSVVQHLNSLTNHGIGEILVNSIDRDGTMKGFDLKLVKMVTDSVNVPVVACGGASCLDDFKQVVEVSKATAVAAGSMFVYKGPHKAVLINYPKRTDIEQTLP
jgi:cyclase